MSVNYRAAGGEGDVALQWIGVGGRAGEVNFDWVAGVRICRVCGRGGVGRTRVWCEARIFGAKIKRVYAHAPPAGALCQQNIHLAIDGK